jgi:putrescine transport system substrate-binding protein
VFFDTMAIPADAKNVDNAYAWINNSLDAKIGAEITNKLGYATANKASLEFVDKEMADNKTIFLSAENLAKMAPRRLPTSPEANKAMNDAFRKFKTGQ